jgi:hypothetical protein
MTSQYMQEWEPALRAGGVLDAIFAVLLLSHMRPPIELY